MESEEVLAATQQELTHTTVVELADRIGHKEVSPVEAVDAAIEAIEGRQRARERLRL